MFEAQSRGQPKLVYARASHNDEVGRDHEGDMTSYVRNLVARMAKDEMHSQQPLKQKQISEIGMHGSNLHVNQQENNKYPNVDKDTYLQKQQPYHLKLTDRGLSTEEKRPAENDSLARKENQSVGLVQATTEKLTALNSRHLQPSSVLNGQTKSSDGKAKTAGSSSVAVPAQRVLPIATSAERLYSSSTSTTITAEKMVMILSHSKSPTPSVTTTERRKSISQTPTAAVGKNETVSSLSKTIAVEKVIPVLSTSTAASGGRHENVSPLLISTSTNRISPVSSTSINIAKEKINTAAPLSKAAAVGMITPVSSNPTASARAKQEVTTTLSKDAVLERSALVPSISSGATSGNHETTSSLSKAATADTLGKLTAAYYESATDASSTSFDRACSSSLKQSPLTPKQIYSSSPSPTSRSNAQHKGLVLQTEHSTVPLSQRQVMETQSQQANDIKLHATILQIYSNTQKQLQISKGQNATSDLPVNNCSPAPKSDKIQSLAMSSSHNDYNQDSEPIRKSSDSFSPSASSSPPKSILKSTTSFDKGDTLLISGHHNEESVDYCDFGPQKTAKIESFSVKKQVQSFFKTKLNSPPPQLKRHVSMDADTAIPELGKDGKVLKKSVTFNSKVRLHLENDESEIDTLPVYK